MAYTDAQKRKFYAIKATLTPAEKELINFYELQWHLRHNVPTLEEVTQHVRKKYPSTRQTSINYYLNRQPVIKRLKDLGIPFQQHTQDDLTATQVATAITVMNFADDRSIPEKLDQLGINASQYYAWLNDPQFRNLLSNLENQNLANIRPAAIAEFTRKVNSGDWNAVKYYLDATGAVQSNNAPQSEILIRMIIEIIQKYVKDENTIMKIAMEIKLASSNRTLEVVDPRLELTGEIVEDDQELAEAKKKLGFG